ESSGLPVQGHPTELHSTNRPGHLLTQAGLRHSVGRAGHSGSASGSSLEDTSLTFSKTRELSTPRVTLRKEGGNSA
ncbi:Hypothetical predicted protein, partial [Marmota monax]